jgi:hypothetical protein
LRLKTDHYTGSGEYVLFANIATGSCSTAMPDSNNDSHIPYSFFEQIALLLGEAASRADDKNMLFGMNEK